jgi:crotonobetainyl-CoA:carnitine CoA-transferase CaiB-like acyl-CoA transferase
LRTASRAGGGDVHMLAPPIRCPGEEMPCEAAPPLGADTDDVLGKLGFASAEIARLRAAGAL